MDTKLFEATNKVSLNENFAQDVSAVVAKLVSERIYNHLKIKLQLIPTSFSLGTAQPVFPDIDESDIWYWTTNDAKYNKVVLGLISGKIYLVSKNGGVIQTI